MRSHEVEEMFPLPIKYSKSVGDSRFTRSGVGLGGFHSRTDVSFDVSGGVILDRSRSLSDAISESLDALSPDNVMKVMHTGGECFYLAGIYSEDNFFTYLSSGLLVRLANLSIGIKFDFYGGKDVGLT